MILNHGALTQTRATDDTEEGRKKKKKRSVLHLWAVGLDYRLSTENV